MIVLSSNLGHRLKFKVLFVLFMALCNHKAMAQTVDIQLEGNTVSYRGLASVEGGNVSSLWYQKPMLTPTNQWAPGGFLTTPATNVSLVGPSGTVLLPIQFKAIQYFTSNAYSESDNTSGSICASSSKSSSIITVSGLGCTYKKWLNTTSTLQPFDFVRPVFQLDETSLKNAFKSVDNGVYVGSVVVNSFYEYYLYGARTKRNFSVSMQVKVDVKNPTVTSVSRCDNTEITPIYKPNGTVSGTLNCKISAEGIFYNGIKLTVIGQPSDDYSLKGPQNTSIPYYIFWTERAEYFVEDGSLTNQILSVDTGVSEQVEINLRLGYKDRSTENLVTGLYSDSVSLLFEPII
ncbi:hypothetical protein [Vibrio cionasavignyae]|uniref:hypothetical protein n=1 Tax=Vibrio cionasavignyae TaxID=2910252 RepID=UPI003D14A536